MKYKLTLIILSIFLVIYQLGCEEPVEQEVETVSLQNTLNDQDIGAVGSLSSYFFNFEDGFDIRYSLYNSLSINDTSFLKPEDTLNFRSYEAYLENEESDTRGYEVITPEMIDVDGLAVMTYIGSEFVENASVVTSVIFKGIQNFSNIEKLEWNYENDRYDVSSLAVPRDDTTLYFIDILDLVFYKAVVDAAADTTAEGVMFIDRGEEIQRSESWSSRDTVMVHEFEFTQNVFGLDSLVYKENTDCNCNGRWDPAEEIITDISSQGDCTEPYTWGVNLQDVEICFVDLGNGLWDEAEVYYDKNSDDAFTGDEPFEDRNCNGNWDDAELEIEEASECPVSTVFIEDNDGNKFCDRGNNKYDFAEEFIDKNNNTYYDEGSDDELLKFRADERPANFLVSYDNYPVLNEPRKLLNIYPGDSLLTRFGILYSDLIKEVTVIDTITMKTEDVDSVITLKSSKIIAVTNEDLTTSNSYNIAKTLWWDDPDANGTFDRNYDYHFFRQGESDNHIYHLLHPSYFKHYGYDLHNTDIINGSPLAFTEDENRFWYEKFARGDALFYSVGNNLRDGERVDTDTIMVTDFGTYHIEESYAVDTNTVKISECEKHNDNCNDIMYSCFRVTREMKMTLLGPGVEYGEKNISWLADGIGIVQDEVYTHWGEPFWITGEHWKLYSVIKLAEFRSLAERAFSGKMFNQQNTVKFDDLEHVTEFDNDPYHISRKVGIQRIGQPVHQEDF